MKGVDLRTVAKLMGHRDISVTMRYATWLLIICKRLWMCSRSRYP